LSPLASFGGDGRPCGAARLARGASGWHGIAAPKSTPGDIIEKLNSAINVWLADPKVRARIAATGYEAFATSPAEFGRFVTAEVEKWVKFANIKPE